MPEICRFNPVVSRPVPLPGFFLDLKLDIDRVSNQITSTATAASGLGTAAGAWKLGLNEWAVIVGIGLTIVFGCLNLALNFYFKQKHFNLAKTNKLDELRRKQKHYG